MTKIDQGDIVRVERAKVPFLVVSSVFYNTSGMIIVCPIVDSAAPDAMHVPVKTKLIEGVVLCEQLASVSISGRGCLVKDHMRGADLLEIVYRVQSIFDYVPHAE